jgi:hypothetical protein
MQAGIDTATAIESAFVAAANDFDTTLSLMRPYRNEREEYAEANLVECFSHAMRSHGFRPYLELPFVHNGRPRLDGIFLRDGSAVLLEAKHFYKGNISNIKNDFDRMLSLDLSSLLSGYGWRGTLVDRFEVVLCDCWCRKVECRWLDRIHGHEFMAGFERHAVTLANGHRSRYYGWLLAYRRSPALPSCDAVACNQPIGRDSAQ